MSGWVTNFIFNYKGDKLEITPQQENILQLIEDNRFTYFLKSRGVGYSILLCNYLAAYLINNIDKTIIIASGNSDGGRLMLKTITNILKVVLGDKSIHFSKSTSTSLHNGCEIRIVRGDITNFKGFGFEMLVFDEYFNSELIAQLSPIIGGRCNKFIIGTSLISLDQALFYKNDNYFFKQKLNYLDSSLWSLNKILDYKSSIGEKQFKYSMDLDIEQFIIDLENKKEKNKDRTLQFRIDSSLEIKLLERINLEDVSISNYIRNLIKKDLN